MPHISATSTRLVQVIPPLVGIKKGLLRASSCSMEQGSGVRSVAVGHQQTKATCLQVDAFISNCSDAIAVDIRQARICFC